MELIHLNPDHRHGGDEPLSSVIDVTGEVATILQTIDLEAEINILRSKRCLQSNRRRHAVPAI